MNATARRAVLAVLMITIGLVHVLDLPGKWEETRWMGVGYLGLIAATIIGAELMLRRGGLVPLALAVGVAVGPFVGFVLTRTTGLPGAMDDIGNWLEPLGLASLFLEAVTVVLAATSAADLLARTTASSATGWRASGGISSGGRHAEVPAPRTAGDAVEVPRPQSVV